MRMKYQSLPFPCNRFTVYAVLWFMVSAYALLRENAPHTAAPPFIHFDKFVHAALFFAQTHLIARSYQLAKRNLPYRYILGLGLVFAIGSEIAQSYCTTSRQGSWGDVCADLLGVALACWFAKSKQNNRSH